MLVVKQKIIKRQDLIDNRNIAYLFGDNRIRKGFGGQAKEMRGELNSIGVITKNKPSMSDGSFLSKISRKTTSKSALRFGGG